MKAKCPGCGATVDSGIKNEKGVDSIRCPYCKTIVGFDPLNAEGDKPGSADDQSVNLQPLFNFFRKLRDKKFFFRIALALGVLSFFLIIFIDEPMEEKFSYERTPIVDKEIQGNSIPSEAVAGGKYSGLLQIITCPEDREKYGRFWDYGYWSGGRWCGKKAVSGYWVWAAPKWYVWSNNNYDINKKKEITVVDSSANGKYSKLLQVIDCPGDKENYGIFWDYGYWSGGRWCGKKAVSGYWVWAAPKWYVWKYKVQ